MRWTTTTVLLVVGIVASAACSGDSTSSDSSSPSTRHSVAEEVADTSASTDPTTEPAAPQPTEPPAPGYESGDSDYLFDDDTLHTFDIELSDEALAELNADPAAEKYVEGALVFEGQTIEPIGVRYKGSVGSFIGCTAGPNMFDPSGEKTCTKLSLKLKINWEDSKREFYGVRTVELRAMNLDPSMMHERLGYWLFREMGVRAPRATHARVNMNGEYLGVFGLVEVVDGRFTREHFDDGTGNLYKEVWPFVAGGAPQPAEVLIDGLETNEDENPTADLMTGFANDLVNAPDGEELAAIEQWLDVDGLLRTLVVDRAIRNDDGPVHWYCFGGCAPHNFYWYEDPTAKTVTLIPWDLDNAFDNISPGSPSAGVIAVADPFGQITNDCQPFTFGAMGFRQISAACDPLFATVAPLEAEWDAIRSELLAGPMSKAAVDEQLAKWTAQLEDAVADAAEAHDDAPSVEAWKASIEHLQSLLETSRAGSGR